jgi:hypothetical protein
MLRHEARKLPRLSPRLFMPDQSPLDAHLAPLLQWYVSLLRTTKLLATTFSGLSANLCPQPCNSQRQTRHLPTTRLSLAPQRVPLHPTPLALYEASHIFLNTTTAPFSKLSSMRRKSCSVILQAATLIAPMKRFFSLIRVVGALADPFAFITYVVLRVT